MCLLKAELNASGIQETSTGSSCAIFQVCSKVTTFIGPHGEVSELFMHLPVILNDGAKLCPATLPTTKRARRNFMKMLKLYPVTENVSTLPTRRRARMDEEDLTSPLKLERK